MTFLLPPGIKGLIEVIVVFLEQVEIDFHEFSKYLINFERAFWERSELDPPQKNKEDWLIDAVVWRCSVEKVFLDISQNSQENTYARVSF